MISSSTIAGLLRFDRAKTSKARRAAPKSLGWPQLEAATSNLFDRDEDFVAVFFDRHHAASPLGGRDTEGVRTPCFLQKSNPAQMYWLGAVSVAGCLQPHHMPLVRLHISLSQMRRPSASII